MYELAGGLHAESSSDPFVMPESDSNYGYVQADAWYEVADANDSSTTYDLANESAGNPTYALADSNGFASQQASARPSHTLYELASELHHHDEQATYALASAMNPAQSESEFDAIQDLLASLDNGGRDQQFTPSTTSSVAPTEQTLFDVAQQQDYGSDSEFDDIGDLLNVFQGSNIGRRISTPKGSKLNSKDAYLQHRTARGRSSKSKLSRGKGTSVVGGGSYISESPRLPEAAYDVGLPQQARSSLDVAEPSRLPDTTYDVGLPLNLLIDDDAPANHTDEREGPVSRSASDTYVSQGNAPEEILEPSFGGFWPTDILSSSRVNPQSPVRPGRTHNKQQQQQLLHNDQDILSTSGIPARMVTDRGEQPQQRQQRRPVRLLSGPISRTESDLFLRQLSEHDILGTSSIPLRQNSSTSRDTEHSHRGGVSRTASEV